MVRHHAQLVSTAYKFDALSVPPVFTGPTPWLMLTLAASVVVHPSVVDEPATIDAGFAVKVAVGSGGGGGSAVDAG